MRAFEMPPHARMSLAQQLLLRALVARFWQQPVPAGAAQALGHRAARPLHAAALRLAGLPRRDRRAARRRLPARSPSGSRRTSKFRFPRLGDFAARGVEVELRHALEPWHVLGEEGAAGGTVRYVDSSVERLQVQGDRPGRRPPRAHLQRPRACRCSRPARVGEFVAGVRYRAWQPPSALHPTIGVHAPLIFDLVDTWMSRSLGGCQYHVAHPGGRNYEHLPGQRLRGRGAPAGALLPHRPHAGRDERRRREAPNPNFPFTLDLRRRS